MKRSPAPLKTAREKNKGRTKATLPNKRIESNPIQSNPKKLKDNTVIIIIMSLTQNHNASESERKKQKGNNY